jgi:ectoine hydroxylase-related dioxygenase (phytanoyl-CoA dioxygenase family)
MTVTDIQETFHRDGVVHVAGAFSEDEMAQLEEFWQFCMDHPGPGATRLYADGMDKVAGVDAARALPEREPGFGYQDAHNPARRGRLAELIQMPAIKALVEAAFGARAAWCVGEQVFLKEPNSSRTPWHQDISDLRVEGMDGMTMWLCLDPVSAEESLELVKGGHLGPTYDSVNGTPGSGPIPDVQGHRNDYDIVSFACQPGDAVLFHLGVLHGGGQTGATYTRRSVALRFYGPDCRKVDSGEPARTDLPVFSD